MVLRKILSLFDETLTSLGLSHSCSPSLLIVWIVFLYSRGFWRRESSFLDLEPQSEHQILEAQVGVILIRLLNQPSMRIFSRESNSRDSVVRLFVQSSCYLKSIINQEFFRHYESRVFSSVMNQEFFKNYKSAFLKRF